MKNTYTCFLAALLISINCFSQNEYFQNFPQWKVTKSSYSGSDCTGTQDDYNYYVGGDSIISSTVYKKIYKKGILTYINAMCAPISSSAYDYTTVSFCMRSAGKKMFVIEAGNSIEELLYDFDLAVGNSLPASYTYNPGSPVTYTVGAIDSINTPFGFRKRFLLSGGSGNDTLYEGIGSTGGFAESIHPLFLSGEHYLKCFSLNNISYVPTVGSSCDIAVSTASIETKEGLKSFPNPFRESMTLQFGSYMQNVKMDVFNSSGEKVRSMRISGNETIIRKEELSPGLYYYLLETGTKQSLESL